jgi:hypothetical protein
MLSACGFFLSGLFRRDHDIIAAKLADLFESFLAGTFTDGEHGHDTANAKDDSKHGQK